MCRMPVVILCVLGFASWLDAGELDRLVDEYNKVKGQVGQRGFGRGGRGGRGRFPGRQGPDATATAERLLNEIGRLGTDNALKFLLGEVKKASSTLATMSARAIFLGTHRRGPNVLVGLIAKESPKVAHAVLDAVVPRQSDNGGRGRWGRPPPREGVAVRWRDAERELLNVTQRVKDIEIKRRLVPVVAKLGGAEGAQGIVSAAATKNSAPGSEALHRLAVDTLEKLCKDLQALDWLHSKSFAFAKSNSAQLAVIAEAAGRLKVAGLRKEIDNLLSRRGRVFFAATEALSYLPGDISESALKKIGRQLKRKLGNVDRARILDALARDGSAQSVELVLGATKSSDLNVRAIAVGSLALAPSTSGVVQTLIAALDDKAFEVRSNACRALQKVRAKELIPPLIGRLEEEPVERLKADALRLLVDLTGVNMGFVTADWKKWWAEAKHDFSFDRNDAGTPTQIVTGKYFGIDVVSTRIAFLVDVSGSMEWPGALGRERERGGTPKLQQMKDELVRILKLLPEDTLTNIVTFSGTIGTWSSRLQPLSGPGRNRAIQFVRGLRTARETNVYDSIELAFKDRRVDTMYLLTDGQPTTGKYTDTADILRAVDELNRVRGVAIHCIAFGERSDLLSELARRNGGVYRFVTGASNEVGRNSP